VFGNILSAFSQNPEFDELAQFFWCFDDPLIFLYTHRPPCDSLRVAFLSARDRCYDFKNILAEKFAENIGVFTQNKAKF
jgi:hypothetical protein